MRVRSNFDALAFAAILTATGCAKPSPILPRAAAPPRAEAALSTAAATPETASPVTTTHEECEVEGTPDAVADDGSDAEHAVVDDGFESAPADETQTSDAPPPFAELSDAEIASRLRSDLGSLGPISIGRAHSGVLVAGMRMPEGENWQLVNPGWTWGTRETVEGLAHAIDAVAARFPNTPQAFVGDISRKSGGHFPPHVSHQSGRDVDVGYYLTEGRRWYATATAASLDRARTWHLVRTLIADSDIDLILIDLKIQRLLKAYALEAGEDPAWLDDIFQAGGKSRRPLIFHAKGHATHLHVRFLSPVAQELGRRAYRSLVARRLISPPTVYITHTVKQGETLSHLALRYKVTTEAIKKVNDLKKDTLRLNKQYKIPQTGGIAMPARVVVPRRRVPPPVAQVTELKSAPCRRAAQR